MPLVIAEFLSVDGRAERRRVYILHANRVYLSRMNPSQICHQDSRNVAGMSAKHKGGQATSQGQVPGSARLV